MGHEEKAALDVGRIASVSDNVFVLAMTLLVLELAVPVLKPGEGREQLASGLLGMAPKFVIFAIGFLLISVYWKAMMAQSRWIARYDQTLLAILVLLLLAVTTIPFGVALLGTYWTEPLSAVVFAAQQAICGLLVTWHWVYVSGRERLLVKSMSARFRWIVAARLLAPVGLWVLVAVIDFWSAAVAAGLAIAGTLLWTLPGVSKLVWYRGRSAA